ncbi:nuclear receptor-interacting protein 1 [Hippocampus zosterae]|uniref:nuclear receptor-interacting protein 1 n=1 Tax=Hippocampus zosterae TaxID=109293 RepID=UPI00223D28F4|nr:nuclear receptor-interacting protein 1 [Hippocampus zosterae]XP_051902184.1 nuclear receptor-interacting protein 1 [Hippocampus zosterae]
MRRHLFSNIPLTAHVLHRNIEEDILTTYGVKGPQYCLDFLETCAAEPYKGILELNMTHGEEPGPETHKDSAVLTYLEGLLMHPVVTGPGATASRRSEAAHSNQDQGDKVGGPFQLPTHGPTVPKAGNSGPTMGASQHLKKARLLRSGAWNDPGNQCLSSPPVHLNGQAGGLQNGSQEDSPHGGESTLLASLLQSFSSRLQNVAMSQHSSKPPSECSSPSTAPPADKEPLPVYGTASSRLKGLMRKSKLQNHSNTPYSRRGHSHDRPPESPRAAHSATPPSATTASESVSCADRLKAVANMVKIRSSPAPSPKPSVACSQLALLLSSEAHLQQYSREHALKAQLSGRSASERLAAMANQQHGLEKRPQSVGRTLPETPDTLSCLTTQNGVTTTNTRTATLPRLALSSPQSPPLLCGHTHSSSPTPPHTPSHFHSQSSREKRGFDSRPTRPPQTCSSLLLLLLNNHNNQKKLTKNGHLEDSCSVLPPSASSSVTSDSECSTHEKSLTKDSSDAETSYSSCSPMDLSMRNWAKKQDTGPKPSTPCSSSAPFSPFTHIVSNFTTTVSSSATILTCHSSAPPTNAVYSPLPAVVSSASTSISSYSSSSASTSSLDKLTESILKKWKPEPSGSNMAKSREHESSPDLKSQSNVTLMQLLLERRNNNIVTKHTDEDLPLDITMATMSQSQPNLVSWDEPRTKSPIDKPGAPNQPTCSLSRNPCATLSPHPPSPQVQSSPLDLCKSKAFPAGKDSEPAFSASKLLQNLAQSGIASSSPPILSGKGLSQELDNSRPLSLLERLNAPINRSTTSTPLSDIPVGGGTALNTKETFPPPSQIENLLERRTVLQLLLGAGSTAASVSRKERPEGSGRRSAELEGGSYERSPSVSNIFECADVPAEDVRVKTEEGVGPSAAISEDIINRNRWTNFEKHCPLSDMDLKTEHRPAEVIAKYGLLSQLLKHQTATYYTSAVSQTESQTRQVKGEKREYPSPSLKKRRLCSDQTLDNTKSPRAFQRGDTNIFTTLGAQVTPDKQKHLKDEEFLARTPPRETCTRESRGFNVLKQLLLSDNCLKELPQQHRGSSSPSILQANGKANGNILSQPAPHHSFLHLPSWHPHGPLNSGVSSHVRTLPTPPASDSLIRNTRGHHPAPWQGTHKRDPPNLVKQEPESPVQWNSQESDAGCDSNPESPRLSRSNPILYYMLQKGSVQLRKEVKNQAEAPQSVVKIKEEPISDMHAYEQSSSPQSATNHNDKHSQDNQRLTQSSE